MGPGQGHHLSGGHHRNPHPTPPPLDNKIPINTTLNTSPHLPSTPLPIISLQGKILNSTLEC
ncbi:hypothetical protein GBA52_019429 [Prunus armeniaca]|nr:hypothetical protein GBA52_019429 [Prunus armeniaca]